MSQLAIVSLRTDGNLAARTVCATRSMNRQLYELSGKFVVPTGLSRYRILDTDSLGYFRELLRLDADWVVNIDEDAFLLDPARLVGLIQHMEDHGYAACGMPDGGVVRIRFHNPAVCNAYFNVFDLRRARRVWVDWDRVMSARPRPDHESLAPSFARRTAYAFDHFERYYGVFFSLLDAGERILYLDAEEWEDGCSTLLQDMAGDPLLIHCWYSRHWDSSYHTRQRYRAVLAHTRRTHRERAQVTGYVPSPAHRSITLAPATKSPWEEHYRAHAEPRPYGDTVTYEKAARFFEGLETVEDWGCGWKWFRRHLNPAIRYKGVDGAHSTSADEVANLTQYTSRADGILLRHVLEHNFAWQTILANAVHSFRKKLAIVLFTPFRDATGTIAYNGAIDVPDLAFAKADIIRHLDGLKWSLEENLETKTQYGVEHIFYVERP